MGLTMTWYPEKFTQQVSIENMHMRPNATSGNPGRSYRFYTGTPVFKFGEGMSYSTFDTHVVSSPTSISSSIFPEDLTLVSLSQLPTLSILLNVSNLSERDGAYTSLLFAAPPDAGLNGRPLQSLVAFEKTHVPAGTNISVLLDLELHHLALASPTGQRQVITGAWTFWLGHN